MSDVTYLIRLRTMIALFCISAATTTTLLIALVPPMTA
ncbi:hypothetical protein FHS95_001369 [Sphingomonas naasensis]|nr:hypothetical protein [Sphingomonas naasensis]